MRAVVLLLLITLLVPRLSDDSSVHASVCLRAASTTMDHAHMMHNQHLSLPSEQAQQNFADDCQHCGDCGVHFCSALSSVVIANVQSTASAPAIARDLVHAISSPSLLIRPPLA